MKKQQIIITIVLGVAVIVAALAAGYSYGTKNLGTPRDTTATNSSTIGTSVSDANSIVSGSASTQSTKSALLYLIEEEKLAHDVYTKMYEKYGATVFGNILKSESTHQSQVLTLLQARGIADPRSSEIGVFKNTELQNLYNQLIAQGNQSAAEAYKVGVAIEEKDIADINTQLETASDEDVITTLEALRRGSENHLRAFNRQLR